LRTLEMFQAPRLSGRYPDSRFPGKYPLSPSCYCKPSRGMNANFNERSENDLTTHNVALNNLACEVRSLPRQICSSWLPWTASSVCLLLHPVRDRHLPTSNILIEECMRGRRRLGSVARGLICTANRTRPIDDDRRYPGRH
jgi:hypothetical protein